jgi:hypothetical protein
VENRGRVDKAVAPGAQSIATMPRGDRFARLRQSPEERRDDEYRRIDLGRRSSDSSVEDDFTDARLDHPIDRERWLAFRDKRVRAVVRQWLAERGIEATTTPRERKP